MDSRLESEFVQAAVSEYVEDQIEQGCQLPGREEKVLRKFARWVAAMEFLREQRRSNRQKALDFTAPKVREGKRIRKPLKSE